MENGISDDAADPLVGVISSGNLFKSGDRGYGFVVSRHRILGARKPDDLEDFEAYLLAGTIPAGTIESAKRVAQSLRMNKDFEVGTGAVAQALIRLPSTLQGGHLIIKLPDRSVRVDTAIVSTLSPEIVETTVKLARIMFEAVGSRLYDGRSGMPYTTEREFRHSLPLSA